MPGVIRECDWEIAVYAIESQQREYLDQWKRSAFIGFQMGAGKEGQTFGDYLKAVGLSDKPDQEPKHKRSERAQAAISDAMRIISKDKKRAAK